MTNLLRGLKAPRAPMTCGACILGAEGGDMTVRSSDQGRTDSKTSCCSDKLSPLYRGLQQSTSTCKWKEDGQEFTCWTEGRRAVGGSDGEVEGGEAERGCLRGRAGRPGEAALRQNLRGVLGADCKNSASRAQSKPSPAALSRDLPGLARITKDTKMSSIWPRHLTI